MGFFNNSSKNFNYLVKIKVIHEIKNDNMSSTKNSSNLIFNN